jgi:hypothetical protein
MLLYRSLGVGVSTWKKVLICRVFPKDILLVPIQSAGPSPTLLQLAHNFNITEATIFARPQILVKSVDQFAKVAS